MKLWRISQETNSGYDTYDSAVVAADDEAAARLVNPDGEWNRDRGWMGSWCHDPSEVKVDLIGEAAPDIVAGIVVASFNAG
jgi:hypothetical protein